MKIGIVSDSHGKHKRLRRTLELFAAQGADAIVHCGDVCSGDCVRLLGDCGVPAYLVAGNMDRHFDKLAGIAQDAGVTFSHQSVEIDLGNGEHLAATHGHLDVLDDLIAGQQFPYVCCGHTHKQRDERVGRTRVINPGALYHPKDPRHPAAAILDTDTDDLQRFDLSK